MGNPRLCAFCDNPANSEEHLWPDWARGLLPEKGAYIAPIIHQALGDHQDDRKPAKPRSAGLRSFRLKVVCKKCNNEWMSSCEEEAKPLLSKLMNGDGARITQNDAQTLSKWLFQKTVVMDNRSDLIRTIPKVDADEFRLSGYVPDYFSATIWMCGEEPWDLLFNQYTTSIPGYRFIFNKTGLRNFRVFSVGFGKLYLLSIVNRSGIKFDIGGLPDGLKLHPNFSGERDWRESRIDASQATTLACIWKTHIESPQIRNMLRQQAYEQGLVSMAEIETEREESKRHGYI